jgi:hypothetical protein
MQACGASITSMKSRGRIPQRTDGQSFCGWFVEVGALIGLGLEHSGAFAAHGCSDEEAETLSEALVALLGAEWQDGVQKFRLGLVAHVFLGGGCVWRHPNTRTARPGLDQLLAQQAGKGAFTEMRITPARKCPAQ